MSIRLPARLRRARFPELTSWPDGTEPAHSSVFAHNEGIVAATPEKVWDCLVAAPRWPRWYPNSRRVVLPPGQVRLAPRTVFRWTTFGVRITSDVVEFDEPRHLGWLWRRPGARGYHGWLIQPHPDGCRVVTEETQIGVVPTLLWPILQPALRLSHDLWIRRLAMEVRSRTDG